MHVVIGSVPPGVITKGEPLSGEVIKFGRDPSCDVRFPSELNIVGRFHCELLKRDDYYQLRFDPSRHPVFVNGKEADQDKALKGQFELALVEIDGPRLFVEIQAAAGVVDMIPTAPVKGFKTIGEHARELQRHVFALSFAGLLLAMVGIWVVVEQLLSNARQDAFVVTIGELNKEVLRSAPDLRDAFSKVQPAIFLVEIPAAKSARSEIGTAWLLEYDDKRRVFVTNAHVVAPLFSADAGADSSLTLRSGESGQFEYVIPRTRIRRHPVYQAYRDYASRAQIAITAGAMSGPVFDQGYDLAILEPLPGDRLPGGIKLASLDDIKALKPGTAVGTTGYSFEGVESFDLRLPVPLNRVGNIINATNFFHLHQSEAKNQMLHHSLQIAGGASGSPIFTANGHVIGVVNAATIVRTVARDPSNGGAVIAGEVMHPISVNFAIRADLIHDLMRQETSFDEQEYIADWTLQKARKRPATLFKRRCAANDLKLVSEMEVEADSKPVQLTVPPSEKYCILLDAVYSANFSVTLRDPSSGKVVEDQKVESSAHALVRKGNSNGNFELTLRPSPTAKFPVRVSIAVFRVEVGKVSSK